LQLVLTCKYAAACGKDSEYLHVPAAASKNSTVFVDAAFVQFTSAQCWPPAK
jgi:hypothetical protein